jgi:hypothetical protein
MIFCKTNTWNVSTMKKTFQNNEYELLYQNVFTMFLEFWDNIDNIDNT